MVLSKFLYTTGTAVIALIVVRRFLCVMCLCYFMVQGIMIY